MLSGWTWSENGTMKRIFHVGGIVCVCVDCECLFSISFFISIVYKQLTFLSNEKRKTYTFHVRRTFGRFESFSRCKNHDSWFHISHLSIAKKKRVSW